MTRIKKSDTPELQAKYRAILERAERCSAERDSKGRLIGPIFEGERFYNYTPQVIAALRLVLDGACTVADAARLAGVGAGVMGSYHARILRIRRYDRNRAFEKTSVVHIHNTPELIQRIRAAKIPVCEETSTASTAEARLARAGEDPADWAVVVVSHPSLGDYGYMVQHIDRRADPYFFGLKLSDVYTQYGQVAYALMRKTLDDLRAEKTIAAGLIQILKPLRTLQVNS